MKIDDFYPLFIIILGKVITTGKRREKEAGSRKIW